MIEEYDYKTFICSRSMPITTQSIRFVVINCKMQNEFSFFQWFFSNMPSCYLFKWLTDEYSKLEKHSFELILNVDKNDGDETNDKKKIRKTNGESLAELSSNQIMEFDLICND